MIRIMIADDHKILRQGIRNLLSTVEDIEICCDFSEGIGLLQAIQNTACLPDLIVMDLQMHHGGIELIRTLARVTPEIPIMVLTMHAELRIAHEALAAGAAGYLTKNSDSEMLITAIQQIAAGNRFIDPLVFGKSALDMTQPMPELEKLTSREAEILKLLADNHSLTDIGHQLGISIKTVSTHKTNLMQKLKITEHSDLLGYAIQAKISESQLPLSKTNS